MVQGESAESAGLESVREAISWVALIWSIDLLSAGRLHRWVLPRVHSLCTWLALRLDTLHGGAETIAAAERIAQGVSS